MKFNAHKIIEILKDQNINKSNQARTIPDLLNEMDNVFEDSKSILKHRTIQESCKFLLWHGILNTFGIFGFNRNSARKIQRIDYYNKQYKFGDVLSIDFGTSNIGNELSYTHTGIVLANYDGFITIVPITSLKEKEPFWITEDLKNTMILIYAKDCEIISDDSYVIFHQIKSVSKNRITKYIGNISTYKIMRDIENIVAEYLTNNILTEYIEENRQLKIQLENLLKTIEL